MTFFHSRATTRQKRNVIHSLRDVDRVLVEDEDGINRVTIDYFHGIFGSSSPTQEELVIVLSTISPRVSAQLISFWVGPTHEMR